MIESNNLEIPIRNTLLRFSPEEGLSHLREMFILPRLQSKIRINISDWGTAFAQGAKVLDVGCGIQPYRELIERQPLTYFSFDVSQNPKNTVTFLGKIDGDLPYSILATAPFDIILITEVMEHVLNWDKAFENLSKLLSDSGEIFLTCPFFFPLHEQPYDYWRPTQFALEALGKSNQLKLIKSEKLGSSVDCLGLLLGHLLVRMKYQQPLGILNRLLISIKQRALKALLLFMHHLVKKGCFEANFSHDSDFYISNCVSFMKHTLP